MREDRVLCFFWAREEEVKRGKIVYMRFLSSLLLCACAARPVPVSLDIYSRN